MSRENFFVLAVGTLSMFLDIINVYVCLIPKTVPNFDGLSSALFFATSQIRFT